MAIRAVCAVGGCVDLALPECARCERHEAERIAAKNAGKAKAKLGEAAQAGVELYRTAAWKALRGRVLRADPLCVDCYEVGLIVAACEVDHIQPHRGDKGLFFRRSNLQALCKSCHSRKTAREVWHTGRRS